MKRSLTFCVLGNSFITWVDRTATSARLPWWQGHTQTLKVPICVMSDALNCPHLLTKTKCLSVVFLLQVVNDDAWDWPSFSSVSSVQSLSCVRLLATPWTVAHKASLSIPTPGVYSNSRSLSQWCHPTISSSVIPFPSCLQSFPASGSFQMSRLFASGGQSTGVSASASVLPMNHQDWFPLGWTGWISFHQHDNRSPCLSLQGSPTSRI